MSGQERKPDFRTGSGEIPETKENKSFWLREGNDLAGPSIHREAGEETEYAGEEPDSEGRYTAFWGRRSGYAYAEGHLTPEKASELCRKSGFTNWERREVLSAEEDEETSE